MSSRAGTDSRDDGSAATTRDESDYPGVVNMTQKQAVQSGESVGTVEITPSGTPVYYQSKPKRLYRIGPPGVQDLPRDVLVAEAQTDSSWREAPSVTTVLGVLDKPALPYWGMKVGIGGTLEVARARLNRELIPFIYESNVDDVVAELVKHKLTVNHQRDKAGDRGQAVHDALENWARRGHMPDPSIYPEEQEGYVRGLVAFLKDVPSAEPEGAEVLVASREHGYAGRYDLRLRTNQEHDVVVRRTATKIRRRTLMPGRYLSDLKTSRGVYGSHARQLEAYEQASIESGYEPTDGRAILLVTPDGGYEYRRSWATFDDFRVVLDVWKSDQGMTARKKAQK